MVSKRGNIGKGGGERNIVCDWTEWSVVAPVRLVVRLDTGGLLLVSGANLFLQRLL